MSDFKKIWDDSSGKLPEAKLIAYLEGRLSPAEAREVEKLIAEDGLESDAVEGLQAMDVADAKDAVRKINLQLQKAVKQPRKKRKYITDNPWAVVAVITVFILVIITYLVIRMAIKK